ncbi:MAG: 4Fe-4S dicluster domain-containing protein [Gammaproteobacteria bacterium]|nr:4Fe-4S dicluster domain-containing protein [Gammaproteobacteria bacterium]
MTCISCKGRCPEGAIRWDERSRPAVFADRCNGCGACVGACPAGALRVDSIGKS